MKNLLAELEQLLINANIPVSMVEMYFTISVEIEITLFAKLISLRFELC